MSVYTQVSLDQAQAIANAYGLGRVMSLTPIKAGVSNTNYFLTADAPWVLTIFEAHSVEQIRPVLALQQSMYEHLIPVPSIAKSGAHCLSFFDGKPLSVVGRLSGEHGSLTLAHAQEIGRFLARLHGLSNPGEVFHELSPHMQVPNNPMSISWLVAHLPNDALAQQVQACAQHVSKASLAKGVIHADLFPDNALFNDNQLTGVIDWYFACVDVLLWDVAVACIAWADGDANREAALLSAYQAIRPLTKEEQACWPFYRVLAAARFWITRAQAEQAPDANLVTKKSAQQMRRLVEHYLTKLDR